ncbi:MAG: hypothetical protein JRE14_13455 [Deltaproteobacteria bacterium]|nr:hypothetical protein [Deltaproteobacteria bacterium]MBW2635103.1 hypothetical protein [Deltaproteobacteria bacterium]
MSKADYSFFFPFRVRYSETDKQGDKVMIKGSVVWVYVDQNTHRAITLPKHLVERLEAREGIH